jgi:hypothetical protein
VPNCPPVAVLDEVLPAIGVVDCVSELYRTPEVVLFVLYPLPDALMLAEPEPLAEPLNEPKPLVPDVLLVLEVADVEGEVDCVALDEPKKPVDEVDEGWVVDWFVPLLKPEEELPVVGEVWDELEPVVVCACRPSAAANNADVPQVMSVFRLFMGVLDFRMGAGPSRAFGRVSQAGRRRADSPAREPVRR